MDEFVKCDCGNMVPSDPCAWVEGDLYQCVTCQKFPAVKLDGKLIPVNDLLNIRKYGKRIHEWIPIGNELRIVNVETPFEDKILRAIVSNRETGTGFTGIQPSFKGTLLANDNEFLGCIIWLKTDVARLSLILIRKEFQRKGYGIKFLKAWVENIADKISDKYEIESPNKGSASLLFKLGHLKMEGKKVIEVKCEIFSSPGWGMYMMFEEGE